MNFRKFLTTFLSVLVTPIISYCPNICFNTGVKTSKPNFNKVSDTIVKVGVEYRRMLEMGFQYDLDSLKEYNDTDLVLSFRRDCEYLVKNKKGVCRHFSNYLISNLRGVGVEAYPLYVKGKNGRDHQAVLYKEGDRFLVADITGDITAINKGDKSRISDPWFFMDDLESFIEEMKSVCYAERIYYLDVDLTDKDIKLDSIEQIEKTINVLFERY